MSITVTTTAKMKEIYTGSKFWVEISGILEGFFLECSALSVQTETLPYKEGGLNNFVHQLPGRTSFPNVTLKRGMSSSAALWSWYWKTANGNAQPLSVSIILYSGMKPSSEIKRWNLINAYPIKWNGTQLSAKSNEFLIESIELVYDYFVVVDSVLSL